MGSAPLDRLRAIAWSSSVLAVVAAVHVIAWSWRAATAGSPTIMRFDAWQRPFVDGPSFTALYVTLAAAVLLLMLPAARRFERVRRVTARFLAVTAAANFVLSVGYLLASYTYEERGGLRWGRPSMWYIALSEFPIWGMAVVGWFLVAATNPIAERNRDEEHAELGSYLIADDR